MVGLLTRSCVLLTAILLLGPPSAWGAPPMRVGTVNPPASAILAAAEAKSAATGRPIFLLVHASWCGECRQLARFLTSPLVGPIFAKNYVIVGMDVMEVQRPPLNGRRDWETPGADVVLHRLVGQPMSNDAPVGLPYFAILDAQGRKIADALAADGSTPGSIGMPGTTHDIGAFGAILKKTAPRMTDAQRAKIIAYLYGLHRIHEQKWVHHS